MKPNRQPNPEPELAIDFVTPDSDERCRERLTRPTLTRSHQVYTGEDGRFTVEWGRRGTWPQSSDAGVILQFIGYLEPVEGGTRVHGTVTDASRRVTNLLLQLTIIAAISTVILFVVGVVLDSVSSGVTLFILAGLVSAGLGIYAVIVQRALAQLAPWVREQLIGITNETQAQEKTEIGSGS